jgi:glycosyltransferase involved in cell wall biosynthesis
MFLNTSQFSPVPMALLEAMSCNCPVISSPTCMIPDIITHGENGLLASTPEEFKQHIELLLSDPALAQKIGVAGGDTIRERFNLTNFINSWNKTLNEAIIH